MKKKSGHGLKPNKNPLLERLFTREFIHTVTQQHEHINKIQNYKGCNIAKILYPYPTTAGMHHELTM